MSIRNAVKKEKGKRHIFIKIAGRQFHWLVIELIAAYALTKAVVAGNSRISQAIDQLLSGQIGGYIGGDFILQLLGLVALGFACSLTRDLSASQFSVNIQQQFREFAGKKLTQMSYKYFDEHTSGGILNKLNSDLRYAGYFFSEILPEICRILIESVTIIVSIGRMDSTLVIFLAVSYPVVILISHFSSNRLAELAKNRWEKIDRLNDIAYDNIQGLIVGRSFNLMPVMEKKVTDANDEILKFEFKRNKLSMIAWTLNSLISWLPNLLLAVLALVRVLRGTLTVGEMTYFILMLDRIIHPLSELPSLFNEAREMGVSLGRLEEIMNQPDEPSGKYKAEQMQPDTKTAAMEDFNETYNNSKQPRTVIEFNEVSFAYDEHTEVLRGVSFQIREGEQAAFVGSSGGGKSTIFKLLCGFYQKQFGSYKLYGQDFEEWDLQSARSLFSLVSQNVFLFPGTIAENVAYGKEGASMQEIQLACEYANIHEFIMSLPEGYKTLVGERGARLSGGERQRISIARAFLKNAPILLLDEPTSAIDVGTEELIKEAIQRISKGRTVITIAHRLSTIEDADTIMVLAEGRIEEEGTNSMLLKEKGIYYELYEKQRQTEESQEEA